jgi:hypothetical protein
LKDCTLITCSYNTPSVTVTMLRSFIYWNGDGPFNLILMENSTDEETVSRLNKHNIPYIRNVGMTHAVAVDKALQLCKTKYALLVDTDIIFKCMVGDLFFENMTKNDATLVGLATSSRAGYKLKTRIDPWFCFINCEHIQNFNIRFYDANDERIIKTNSNGFYNNVPINKNIGQEIEMYDVGSTFFEDIKKANLKVFDLKDLPEYYKHYEGMSWYQNVGEREFDRLASIRWQKYRKEIEKYRKVKIDGKFI